jgi:hypothetical protein
MKRLLLIGIAACSFAVLPILSASAMPHAPADTLTASSDSSVIHAGWRHGGHHHGWGGGHHHHRGWR